MVETFQVLLGSAATRPLADAPAYLSDVVDDHTPYEMSVAVGGDDAPELRVLVEPCGNDTSLGARWHAALAAGRWLQATHGIDLARFEQVVDLFEPRRDDGLLALWYALVFRPNAPLEAKAYVDLRAHGASRTHEVLEEALARLGLGSAYPSIVRDAACRGPLADELVYFSIDLAGHESARVKVYLRHHGADLRDVERVIGARGGTRPGDVAGFCTTILGDRGPYLARPLVSCWSYTGGQSEPTGATLYAPIAYYVRDDAQAAERIQRWLAPQPDAAAHYDRYLSAFARRPLGDGVGMHSYVSFKRARGAIRSTMYLAPEAYRTQTSATLATRRVRPPQRPQTPEALVDHFETVERITDHPVFRRLEREPPSVGPLWTILANNWVGVGAQFPTWLRRLVDRVDAPAIRAILEKQLADELGHGDPAQAHRALFQRMLDDLEPYAPAVDREVLLGPGRRFAQFLAHNYTERPTAEALGGTLIAEVYGKQVDQRIGDLLRRNVDLDVGKLTWLVLHETLEIEHADESAQLARMLPDAAAACRGAEAMATRGMRYFDDLYEVLFP